MTKTPLRRCGHRDIDARSENCVRGGNRVRSGTAYKAATAYRAETACEAERIRIVGARSAPLFFAPLFMRLPQFMRFPSFTRVPPFTWSPLFARFRCSSRSRPDSYASSCRAKSLRFLGPLYLRAPGLSSLPRWRARSRLACAHSRTLQGDEAG